MVMKERRSPLLSTIEFSDNIFDSVDQVFQIILWAVAVAIWMIVIGIMYIIEISEGVLDWMIVIGVLFGFSSPFIIRKGVSTYRRLNSSIKDFFPFYYIIKFELFPPFGKSPQEKIWNKLTSIFPDLGGLDEDPEIVKFNSKIKGKQSEYFFDIYVDLSKFEDGDIFVRRLDIKKDIEEKDFQTLKDDIEDVCKKKKTYPRNITIVSTTSYTISAINYAKNKDNWVKKCNFDLVLEKPEKYEVVWAGE